MTNGTLISAVTIDKVDDQTCNVRIERAPDHLAYNQTFGKAVVLSWLTSRGPSCEMCADQVRRGEKAYVGHPPVSAAELENLFGITLPIEE